MFCAAGAADRSEYRTWNDSIHRADSPSKPTAIIVLVVAEVTL
jgi:hypothetical protein